MATAIQSLEPSSSLKKCNNLLKSTTCLVYIDSSSNRSKIHTYAAVKEHFYLRVVCLFACLFDLILYIPVNILLVMSRLSQY